VEESGFELVVPPSFSQLPGGPRDDFDQRGGRTRPFLKGGTDGSNSACRAESSEIRSPGQSEDPTNWVIFGFVGFCCLPAGRPRGAGRRRWCGTADASAALAELLRPRARPRKYLLVRLMC